MKSSSASAARWCSCSSSTLPHVTPAARLYEDLEIDSIDVVDLMDEVQRHTGQKVTPEDFHSVRTVGDLVTVMQRLLRP